MSTEYEGSEALHLFSSSAQYSDTCIILHTSAYGSIRQHTAAYGRIRQQTSARKFLLPPLVASTRALNAGSCVSICTFVLVKRVDLVPVEEDVGLAELAAV